MAPTSRSTGSYPSRTRRPSARASTASAPRSARASATTPGSWRLRSSRAIPRTSCTSRPRISPARMPPAPSSRSPQTLGVPFGSGFAVPGTGIVLNNILKWMDRDPVSPNVLRPGRKAGTMMSPTQVFRDGAFNISIGTPGSYGILQTTPQMLLNVLEFGMSIQEAIEAPRARVYRDRLIDAESRIPAETRSGLAERGHSVNLIDDWSWIVGGGQGIVRDPESGALMAGGDPRPAGYAPGVDGGPPGAK